MNLGVLFTSNKIWILRILGKVSNSKFHVSQVAFT